MAGLEHEDVDGRAVHHARVVRVGRTVEPDRHAASADRADVVERGAQQVTAGVGCARADDHRHRPLAGVVLGEVGVGGEAVAAVCVECDPGVSTGGVAEPGPGVVVERWDAGGLLGRFGKTGDAHEVVGRELTQDAHRGHCRRVLPACPLDGRRSTPGRGAPSVGSPAGRTE